MSGIRPESGRTAGRAGGRAVGLLLFWEKHVPGFLEHVFCGFCDFWAISRSPGKKIKIWPILSNDYARKTRIEIISKKTCYNAPYIFFKVWFLKQFLDFANLGLNVNLKNRGRPKGGPKILVYITEHIGLVASWALLLPHGDNPLFGVSSQPPWPYYPHKRVQMVKYRRLYACFYVFKCVLGAF